MYFQVRFLKGYNYSLFTEDTYKITKTCEVCRGEGRKTPTIQTKILKANTVKFFKR